EKAGGHSMEAGLKIALLGPADETDRVIVSAPLVVWIVPARSVRPGESELNFLFGEHAPGQFDFRDADIDNASAITTGFSGLFNRGIALRGGANDSGINAPAFGPEADLLAEILLADDDNLLGTHLFGNASACGQEINPHDACARSFEEIRDEKTDQPLAHDQNTIAQTRLGLADGMKRNRTKCGVRRLPIGNLFRDGRGQHVRDGDIFGVKCAFSPAASNPITHAKPAIPFIDRHDDARRAVTEGA